MGAKFDMLARMGRVAEEDQAQVSHDEFVSLQLNSLDYLQLRLVEEALDRLNSGDYGICLTCDLPIPPKRLEALPWARYCVQCQEEIGDEPDGLGRVAYPAGALLLRERGRRLNRSHARNMRLQHLDDF